MGQVTSIHPDQAIRAAPAAYPAPNADLVQIKYGVADRHGFPAARNRVLARDLAVQRGRRRDRAHAERAARLALGKLEPQAAEDVVQML